MSLTLASIQTLFPTPLVTFQVEGAEELNRDLIAEIAKRRTAEAGRARSNRQGWHSDFDLFRRKEKAQARIAATIRDAVEQATSKLAPKADLSQFELECEGWLNVNPSGAYNSPHDHPGFLWSGTYYVATPDSGDDSSGRIEFIDARASLGDQGVKAPFTASKASIRPKPGMLLLFPANLVHWVHPNASDEERVTIAFNARFRPKGGASAPPR